MKRTTVLVPDSLDTQLRYLAKRRRVSVTTIVREALQDYIPSQTQRRELRFVGIGESNAGDVSERFEEYLADALADDAKADAHH